MTQKVIKIGSSVAVVIPKNSLKELGLKAGDRVSIKINARRKTIVIEPQLKIDRELLRWTNNFIKKYRPALETLSRK